MLIWEQSKEQIPHFTHGWVKRAGRGYQNEEILKFVPFRLKKSPTQDNNQGNIFSQLIYNNEAQKYA